MNNSVEEEHRMNNMKGFSEMIKKLKKSPKEKLWLTGGGSDERRILEAASRLLASTS